MYTYKYIYAYIMHIHLYMHGCTCTSIHVYIYIYAVIHKDMHAKHKCTHTPTTTNNPYIYIDTHRQTYATEEMQPAISEVQPRFLISVLFVLKRCNHRDATTVCNFITIDAYIHEPHTYIHSYTCMCIYIYI